MVFLDDVDDALIELVLQSEIDAFFDVRNNDQRAHGRGEIIVRIAFEAHIFSEILRLHQFADVMKIGADATESGVSADRLRRCFG